METILNEVQQQIVEDTEGAIMVLAGAGSGKTRVLTNRINFILKNKKANFNEILAITFTNKAANEIKNRLISDGNAFAPTWAMTFHSMCCKILRLEAEYLEGYTSSFSIYDEQDKKNTIKKILKENNLKEDEFLAEVSQCISNYKISNVSLEEYKLFYNITPHKAQVCEIIEKYETKLKQSNAMDFDDLINKTLVLLQTNQYVCEKYQQKFKYILVDEFQDTNETQYNLVKILSGYHGNIFAVGDEDQSIYSWRGASIDNIKRFLKDFPNAKLYKLEQNYRSTKNIIEYANKIIKNNHNRIDKTLFTENDSGSNVVYSKSFTDREEAEYVVKTIQSLVKLHGYNYSDVAVLMRLNALSRNFEEKLLNYGVPYKMFGGQKFYERAEIKNIMAYLKLLVNNQDEESFYRIINFPKRGIGDGAIAKLKEINQNCLLNAVLSLPDNCTGALAKFIPFKLLITDLLQKLNELSLFDFVDYTVTKTNILSAYAEDTDENYNRKLNISEFLQLVKQYEEENEGKTLVDFLQSVSLTTDIDSYETDNNTVTLATVHSVKGLEFKVVFVVGLEERFFPIIRVDTNDDDIEEERRLMYVAITRAREKLYLTCSKSRFMYGKQNFSIISRFIKELGYENTNNVVSENSYKPEPKRTFAGGLNSFFQKPETKQIEEYAIGERVFHTKFGIGYIVSLDNVGKIVKIDFESFGNKILSLDFAPIKKI